MAKRWNETEAERLEREMMEEAAEEAVEMEAKAKARRTCVGELCAFMENLGMLMSREFAYTCTYNKSPRHGLIFTKEHRVCDEMFD